MKGDEISRWQIIIDNRWCLSPNEFRSLWWEIVHTTASQIITKARSACTNESCLTWLYQKFYPSLATYNQNKSPNHRNSYFQLYNNVYTHETKYNSTAIMVIISLDIRIVSTCQIIKGSVDREQLWSVIITVLWKKQSWLLFTLTLHQWCPTRQMKSMHLSFTKHCNLFCKNGNIHKIYIFDHIKFWPIITINRKC